jgi:transposase
MSREFDGLYARVGRPSIPPERLLRAQLLQIFYSIRSERLLMEQLDYNLLFRWFVGMDMDEPIWDPTVFTKNRDRLLNQDIARSFFRRVEKTALGCVWAPVRMPAGTYSFGSSSNASRPNMATS